MRNPAVGLQEWQSTSDVTFYDLIPMPKQRHINADPNARSLPSSLAVSAGPVREVAWIVEERVVWRGVDLFRALFDTVKWPFEQLVWHAERRLVWPIQERTADWSPAARVGGTLGIALLLVGIVAVTALPSASNHSSDAVLARNAGAAVAPPQPSHAPAAAPASTLHGAPPVFTSAAGTGGVKASSQTAEGPTAHASAVASTAEPSAPATSAAPGEVAGKEAIAAAREFADAFVLYETGQTGEEVRSAFRTTAAPQLSASLLHRPPRLPANVEVPQAKVLNIVPGPQLGDDCTVSVSLLRVGVTSELRLSLHRTKDGSWLVKEVLG
jgi:hypothetical protein